MDGIRGPLADDATQKAGGAPPIRGGEQIREEVRPSRHVPPQRHSRVLIVARRTADSPELLEAVARRARQGPCNFTLLVPAYPAPVLHRGDRFHSGQRAAERRIASAVPLLSSAAGAEVVAVLGAGEPLVAVRDALAVMGFDEVIVSLLPAGASRWRQLDLPRKIAALGVPVIEVQSVEQPAPPLPAA